MNKSGIELSINFLVIVIISIVMLTSGILLIKNYFGTAEDIKDQLDEQTISQIESLLDEGDYISMPLNRKTISAGESSTFGLGVLNVLSGSPTTFDVNITLSRLVKKDKTEATQQELNSIPDPENWILYEESFTISYKSKKAVAIYVEVPKGVFSGTYIYDIGIPQYQNRITKMYVIVP
jgi:hypothetical protein